jgi:hypothetical protein
MQYVTAALLRHHRHFNVGTHRDVLEGRRFTRFAWNWIWPCNSTMSRCSTLRLDLRRSPLAQGALLDDPAVTGISAIH